MKEASMIAISTEVKIWYWLIVLIFWLACVSGEWFKLLGDDVGNQQARFSRSNFHENTLPGARSASATWMDYTLGDLWSFGGVGFGNESSEAAIYLNDLWLFNSTKKQWHLVNSGRMLQYHIKRKRYFPRRRKGAVACGVPGVVLVIFGGMFRHQMNDTWLYDIRSGIWLPLYMANDQHNISPTPRSHSMCWCLRDRMIIYGGIGEDGSILSDMWEFLLEDLIWQPKKKQHYKRDIIHTEHITENASHPIPRIGASTWCYQNHAYMFGGTVLPETKNLYKQKMSNLLSDLWLYDPKTENWKLLMGTRSVDLDRYENKILSPSPRIFAQTWRENKYLYIFGGYGQFSEVKRESRTDFMQDTWRYSIESSTWISISDIIINNDHVVQSTSTNNYQLPSQRCCGVAWCAKNDFYLFGGFGYDGRHRIAYLNNLFIGNNISDVITKESAINRMVQELSPPVIFAICFGTFGSLVFIFGAMFFLKKMIDYPEHAPPTSKYVKYTPVNEDISFKSDEIS